MTVGQAITTFTLGVSAAISLFAIGAAAVVLFSDQAFVFAASQLGMFNTEPGAGSRFVLCALIAGAGIAVAYYLAEIQQWIARRLADRALRRLRGEFERIERQHGTEAAEQWFAGRLPSLLGRESNLFGEQDAARLFEQYGPAGGKAP